MELITLIILIIVCGVGILLAFRVITFLLRILSVVFLLVAILSVAGSYFMAQAYVLPPAHTAFVTLTADGGFVMSQNGVQQFTLDSAATAALSREFIRPITAFNSSAYTKLKAFAKDDIFATQDTVWVVNAIAKQTCTQERVASEPKLFATLCFDASATRTQTEMSQATVPRFIDRIKALVDISALNRVPIKASFWQWLLNYYLK